MVFIFIFLQFDQRIFMNKSPIILFGNGEVPTHPAVLEVIKDANTIISLDGGTDKLIDLGYRPSYILGDLDSLASNPDEYGCEFKTLYDQSKNDLEKGLEWCLDNEIQKLSLVGFSGLRDDHGTATLFSLKSFSEQMDLAMFTNFSIVHCTKGRSRFNASQGQVISIIASNSYTRIRTNGLKHELNNEVLFSPSNGISNIALVDSVEIESDDWVWVFLNHME